jgi:hypothetical protein
MSKRQKIGNLDGFGTRKPLRKPPPEEHRFKRGNCASVGYGRPKHALFDQAARAILSEVDPKLQKSGAERLVEQMFRRALQGSFKHAELLLGYAMGRPVAQNLNVNANVNNEPQMSDAEVHEKLAGMFERMGIPRAVATPAGLRMDLDAVQVRVNQLIEKRRQKALPAPAMAPGSEIVQ